LLFLSESEEALLSPRQILTPGGVITILSSPSLAMSPPNDVLNSVSFSIVVFNSSRFRCANGVIFNITIVLSLTSDLIRSNSLEDFSGRAFSKMELGRLETVWALWTPPPEDPPTVNMISCSSLLPVMTDSSLKHFYRNSLKGKIKQVVSGLPIVCRPHSEDSQVLVPSASIGVYQNLRSRDQ